MKYQSITKENGRSDRINESAPKYTIIKAGFVIAITLAALPKETGQLIPMKTWICACFLVSNVILMNGIASIK